MSIYIPEIKEEVSENAKMLVEDDGKIVRTAMPKSGGNFFCVYAKRDDNGETVCNITYDEFMALMENDVPVIAVIYRGGTWELCESLNNFRVGYAFAFKNDWLLVFHDDDHRVSIEQMM